MLKKRLHKMQNQLAASFAKKLWKFSTILSPLISTTLTMSVTNFLHSEKSLYTTTYSKLTKIKAEDTSIAQLDFNAEIIFRHACIGGATVFSCYGMCPSLDPSLSCCYSTQYVLW